MNIIIKKWIQPYLLIEYLKDFYNVVDLTFDGSTKSKFKTRMFDAVQTGKIGLYMKNVNKFYLLSDKANTNLKEVIKEKLSLCEGDFSAENDAETALALVDMGKSEASFIIKK